MNLSSKFVLTIIAIVVALSTALGQNAGKETAATDVAGFRGDFLYQLGEVEQKVVDLAGAMPAEKYSWRPMEGVRSVSEVYMHIAGANYLLPSFVGFKSPEGINRDMEKTITDKSGVVDALKKSFAFIREAVLKTSDADLEKPAKLFGRETTVRDVFFSAALHMHEHMGQSIAYARMNSIVPPWTAAEQAAEEKKNKK
jgi:uncharacterized damage-inducible protein DinB